MCSMGHAWQGACVADSICGRVCTWQGACVAGEMATAVDGTHPTGMHSWFENHSTMLDFLQGCLL